LSNLQELLAQRAELERKISETQKAQRSSAIAKIREIMAENGLTVEDLGGRSLISGHNGSASKKAPIKYRDDSSGNSWSGRGLKPKWLQQALDAGRNLSDFAI
jgi:DNA-binding protein H-NS